MVNAESDDLLPFLVGDTQVLAESWEESPFVSTNLPDLAEIFSLDTIEQLIFSGSLPLPAIRLFRDGVALPTTTLGRSAERVTPGRERLVDGPATLAEVGRGATLVVEELQTYCPSLARLTATLTARSGYRTYCAAFLTPPYSRGVDPHYDTASVFIRQLEGSKRWRVAKPAERWPVREQSQKPRADTDEVLDVELRAGQCLYIPRGFVHAGTATSQASVHLSVGLIPPIWAAMLRRLVEKVLAEEQFREALPFQFHNLADNVLAVQLAERVALFSARLGELAGGAAGTAAIAQAAPRSATGTSAPGSLRAILTAGGSPDSVPTSPAG